MNNIKTVKYIGIMLILKYYLMKANFPINDMKIYS